MQASTPEAAQGLREPAGINEQLFAQMLQAREAAVAGTDGNASEPASADKNSTADGKKKGPVMLKGARLAFSRPGIIAGRQPNLNKPAPGSQVGGDASPAHDSPCLQRPVSNSWCTRPSPALIRWDWSHDHRPSSAALAGLYIAMLHMPVHAWMMQLTYARLRTTQQDDLECTIICLRLPAVFLAMRSSEHECIPSFPC